MSILNHISIFKFVGKIIKSYLKLLKNNKEVNMKTSIDIIFPEIDELLGGWRKKTIELSQRGVPPHISIVYPWLNAPLNQEDITAIEKILSSEKIFIIEFISIEKFENGVVYLALSNSENIRKIQKNIMNKYSGIKMYDGMIKNPIFHLTIAKLNNNEDIKFKKIKEEIAKFLPLKKEIKKITIMVEDENECWSNYKHIKLKSI